MQKVVVYHSISSPEVSMPSFIDVSPERFERQLRWLSKRRDRVVSLYNLVSKPMTEDLYGISFDDGFKDNVTVALPLLEKYKLPWTLFVVAGFVGEPEYLEAKDVRKLARHPLVTIGSHGLTHRHLSKLDDGETEYELTESKRMLEEIAETKIDLLAYPYGDCNEKTQELAVSCGYRAAWSVWNGENSNFSRWRVPLGRHDNMPRFVAKVSPAYFPVKRLIKPPIG